MIARPSATEADALLAKGACPHCFALGTFSKTSKSHTDTDKIKVAVFACSACGWEEGRPATAKDAERMRELRNMPPRTSGLGSRANPKLSRLGLR